MKQSKTHTRMRTARHGQFKSIWSPELARLNYFQVLIERKLYIVLELIVSSNSC